MNPILWIPACLPSIIIHGSSFKETTRDCLFRFATFTSTTERQDGTHHGRRTFCSPLRQATAAKASDEKLEMAMRIR
ncbi:unnamed protein product [Linum trigynum]|uniref:Secreted protein n=1 Tax=Linum trigynum TaxID=586398 RepID=A0AAV2CIV2_9ROSI